MTEQTWRGHPLYTSGNGKFASLNPELVAAYDRDHAPVPPSPLLRVTQPEQDAPADDAGDSEQAAPDAAGVNDDGPKHPDENGSKPKRVSNRRRNADVRSGKHDR